MSPPYLSTPDDPFRPIATVAGALPAFLATATKCVRVASSDVSRIAHDPPPRASGAEPRHSAQEIRHGRQRCQAKVGNRSRTTIGLPLAGLSLSGRADRLAPSSPLLHPSRGGERRDRRPGHPAGTRTGRSRPLPTPTSRDPSRRNARRSAAPRPEVLFGGTDRVAQLFAGRGTRPADHHPHRPRTPGQPLLGGDGDPRREPRGTANVGLEQQHAEFASWSPA